MIISIIIISIPSWNKFDSFHNPNFHVEGGTVSRISIILISMPRWNNARAGLCGQKLHKMNATLEKVKKKNLLDDCCA